MECNVTPFSVHQEHQRVHAFTYKRTRRREGDWLTVITDHHVRCEKEEFQSPSLLTSKTLQNMPHESKLLQAVLT